MARARPSKPEMVRSIRPTCSNAQPARLMLGGLFRFYAGSVQQPQLPKLPTALPAPGTYTGANMLYTPGSVWPGTKVTDLDTRQCISRVVGVDTDAGEIHVQSEPLRVQGDRVVTETLKFAAVWPVLDRGIPCAFHCHGRQ